MLARTWRIRLSAAVVLWGFSVVLPVTTHGQPLPLSVRVLWPNGGEVFGPREPVTVEWSVGAEGTSFTVEVLVSYDNGATFDAIARGEGITSFAWVPSRSTRHALVRVEAEDGGGSAGVDESDAVFAVGSFPAEDGGGAGVASAPLPTTKEDFQLPGTQPGMAEPILDPVGDGNCAGCHQSTGAEAIFHAWSGSMMANASRDPLFYACLAIAEQDAPGSGDLCLRCHIPKAWLAGRSDPTDGSAVLASDLSGVSCNFCHRMVDPIFVESPGAPDLGSPEVDGFILSQLAALGLQPADLNGPKIGNGMYVIDPENDKNVAGMRGPRRTTSPGHAILVSPFHRDSAFCGTCHDVSNPAYSRNAAGKFVPNAFNQRAVDVSPGHLMPIERTYSEWAHSEFAVRPVLAGDFGWVQTCQDCHMADTSGKAGGPCPPRDDLAHHDFTGGNAWVPQLIATLYPEIDPALFGIARARAVVTLQRAAKLSLSQLGTDLRVRVINNTGHKLPTGYPEGRRMWLQVSFLDKDGAVIKVSGDYDSETAELFHDPEIKVYEAELGIDSTVSSQTGIPAGQTFHFVLNNVVLKDNRIPPRGFTNDGFRSFNGEPVGAQYADRQHWDDTLYAIPLGAANAIVELYYQTSSKEYIEFLRDKNVTNNKGQELYDLWSANPSPPVRMASAFVELNALTTVFVDRNATGTASGTTWDDAVTSLHSALAAANANECIHDVSIAAGSYSLLPVGQIRTFLIRPGLNLTGGFGRTTDGEVVFDPERFETIIDGKGTLEHVVTINGEAQDPPSRLEYLTIRGGNATAAGQRDGGGILVNGATLSLAFVKVLESSANLRGGGIFVHAGSLSINRCEIRGNASQSGAGIYLDGGELTAISSTFTGNTASESGGAFHGALGTSSFVSSALSQNSALRGGAMYVDQGTLELSSSTVSANSAATRGGGVRLEPTAGPGNEVVNSILWGNMDSSGTSAVAQIAGNVVVEYSCVQDKVMGDGSVFPGTGNIDVDPLLTDPAQGLLTLQPASPCIDAGDSARPTGNRDLFSRARRIDDPETVDTGNGSAPIVDMGAVEFARTLYVDPNASDPVANGRSWPRAYRGLRDALDEALEPGSQVQEIHVAPGLYRPAPASDADRTATFRLRDGLRLLGGFPTGGGSPTARDPAAHPAILSGDLRGNDANGRSDSNRDNSFHVVTVGAGENATLNGFTIRGGNADGAEELERRGGGLLVDGGTLLAVDCVLAGNAARSRGGAVYVSSGGAFECERCVFRWNTSSYGGGIAVIEGRLTLHGSTLVRSSAGGGSGGAIFLLDSEASQVVNCVFFKNSATGAGGGIFSGATDLEVLNCSLSGNSAPSAGGIRTSNGPLAVKGSVLWGNRDEGSSLTDAQLFGAAAVRYSCIEGGWSGDPLTDVGNIDLDPRFANAEVGDLRLTASSPCIDAGDNDALPPTALMDVHENPRRHDHPDTPDTGNGTAPIVDMGAHEFDESTEAEGGGDFDDDGRVNRRDAIAFWGVMTGPGGVASSAGRRAFDADRDRDVDMVDFLAFLRQLARPAASAPTQLDLRVTSAGAARVRVPAGERVEYELRGLLRDKTNLGLAAVVFDLSFTGGDLEPLALPVDRTMQGFVPLAGITNPQGFGGKPEAGWLLQAGGAQNVWGTGPKELPYPIGTVIERVAHGELVLARGTLQAPGKAGTYSLDLSSVAGGVLQARPVGPGLPWTVGPLVAGRIGSLEVEVVEIGFRRGDTNGDAEIDISDAVATLVSLFLGTRTLPCLDAADANDDGRTDVSDAVAMLLHLFLGGAAPPAPGPFSCGEDPTGDGLDCAFYAACR